MTIMETIRATKRVQWCRKCLVFRCTIRMAPITRSVNEVVAFYVTSEDFIEPLTGIVVLDLLDRELHTQVWTWVEYG